MPFAVDMANYPQYNRSRRISTLEMGGGSCLLTVPLMLPDFFTMMIRWETMPPPLTLRWHRPLVLVR